MSDPAVIRLTLDLPDATTIGSLIDRLSKLDRADRLVGRHVLEVLDAASPALRDGVTDSEDGPVPPSLAASLSATVLHAVPDPPQDDDRDRPRPPSSVPPALVARAERIAAGWPADGEALTRDRLRAKLGTSTGTASSLHAYLRESGQVAS